MAIRKSEVPPRRHSHPSLTQATGAGSMLAHDSSLLAEVSVGVAFASGSTAGVVGLYYTFRFAPLRGPGWFAVWVASGFPTLLSWTLDGQNTQ